MVTAEAKMSKKSITAKTEPLVNVVIAGLNGEGMTVRITIDEEGPGSFASVTEYVEDVLRENFAVIPEKDMTTGKEDQYMRQARNIVTSILSRLDIEII